MEPPTFSVIKAEFGDCQGAKEKSSSHSTDAAPPTSIIKACEIADENYNGERSYYEKSDRMEPPSFSVIKAEFEDKKAARKSADPSTYSVIMAQFEDVYQKDKRSSGNIEAKDDTHQTADQVRTVDPSTYSVIMAQFEDAYQKPQRSSTELPNLRGIADDGHLKAATTSNMDPQTYSVVKAACTDSHEQVKGSTKDLPVESVIRACQVADSDTKLQAKKKSATVSSLQLSRDEGGAVKKSSWKRNIFYRAFCCCFHR